ncbi:type VII secretion target [Nocardia sp. NPDC048505]|uniref:type VII secretion target n=1 Tax=unclassified Nocardia TaxID=2637762 RepID=UPI0033CA734A
MAEELKVTPDNVDKFATAMRDLSTQAGSAKDYSTKWFEFGENDGRIYMGVKDKLDEVRQNLEANYAKLRTLSENAATELGKAATMYRTTDLDTAKKMDTTYTKAVK